MCRAAKAWLKKGAGVRQYQYNGKELNQDFGLNWMDYGARWYDAAIGRFGTIDRFAEKYSSMSGYGYAAGNPVKFIDINGDSLRVSFRSGFLGIFGKKVNLHMEEDGHWYDENGDRYGYDNLPKAYQKKTSDLLTLMNDPDGVEVLTDVIKSKVNVELKLGGDYLTKVKYDEEGNLEKITITGSGKVNLEGENFSIPGYIGLGHELQHAKDRIDGRKSLFIANSWGRWPMAEVTATHFENQLRANSGISLREFYDYNDESTRVLVPGTSIPLFNQKAGPYRPTPLKMWKVE